MAHQFRGSLRQAAEQSLYAGLGENTSLGDSAKVICGNDAGQIHRFTPDGRLDRSVAVPVAKPAMCAFGGERLDTLFVTSIRTNAAEDALSGAVFALQPGVQGLAEPVLHTVLHT